MYIHQGNTQFAGSVEQKPKCRQERAERSSVCMISSCLFSLDFVEVSCNSVRKSQYDIAEMNTMILVERSAGKRGI